MKSLVLSLVVLSLSAVLSTRVNAQFATVDNSFSVISGSANFNNAVNTTVLQRDGKVLVGGNFTNFNNREINGIARLNRNGSVDYDFNAGASGHVNCLKLQSNDKIVLAGYFENLGKVLTRLNADGSVDTTFNLDARIVGVDCHGFDIQSDGKIIVGLVEINSKSGAYENKVYRLNSNGAIDTTFQDLGVFSNFIRVVRISTNGNIFIGGSFTNIDGDKSFKRLVMLDADGKINREFSNAFTINNGAVNCLDIQNDGKVIIGGAFTSINGMTRNRIAEINADGSLDETFSGLAFDNDVYDLRILPNNKILAIGQFKSYGKSAANGLIQFNLDGTIESTLAQEQGFSNGHGKHISIQEDGKIVLSGVFKEFNGSKSSMVVRIHGDNVVGMTGR